MTQPDHGDGDQLPELSPDLWEPLSDDVFSRMLSDAMDPLAEPVDLSDVPDQAEDYPEGYVFDGDAGDPDEDDLDDGSDVGDLGDVDDLDDLDNSDGFDDLGDLFPEADGTADGYDDEDSEDIDGGDAL